MAGVPPVPGRGPKPNPMKVLVPLAFEEYSVQPSAVRTRSPRPSAGTVTRQPGAAPIPPGKAGNAGADGGGTARPGQRT